METRNAHDVEEQIIYWSIVHHNSAVAFLGRFLVGHNMNVNRNFEYHTNIFDP